MRLQHIALLVLCVSGCADAVRRAVDSGHDAGPPRAGGIELSGIVSTSVDGTNLVLLTPVEGVEVCQDGVPNCAMTDVTGWFTLGGIKPQSEILLVYRKDGFWPSLQPVVAPSWSSVLGVSNLLSRDYARASGEKQNAVLRDAGRPERDVSDEAIASRAAILFGENNGADFVWLSDQLRVELDPDSSEAPVFLTYSGDVVLEVPKGGGGVVVGVYPSVEPRDDGYELVYQYEHGECRQTASWHGGWPSASGRPNATRVPARAGYLTATTFEECKLTDAGTPSDDAGQP
jgi:hypothetical protein